MARLSGQRITRSNCSNRRFGVARKFSKNLGEVAEHHHDPRVLFGSQSIPWIVHVAARRGVVVSGGFRLDLPDLQEPPAAYDAIGLSPSSLDVLPEDLDGMVHGVDFALAA